jgi:hypothetical protein
MSEQEPALRQAALWAMADYGSKGRFYAFERFSDPLLENNYRGKTRIVLGLRKTPAAQKVADGLANLWEEKGAEIPVEKRRESEFFRAAVVELIADLGAGSKVGNRPVPVILAGCLRKDPSWRVRRAALCGLIRCGGAGELSAVRPALDDGHPAVAGLAMAASVALTAVKEEDKNGLLGRLGRGPQPALYREIFRAEKLDFEALSADRVAFERVLAFRTGGKK